MSHNRKRRDAEARERRRRERALEGAVVVDASALAEKSLWEPPIFVSRGYYVDIPFTCASCGSDEVWTGAQQKWWYEVAKGSIYSSAKLCLNCRRDARDHRGRAVPIADLWRWPAMIRDALEPALLAEGWARVDGVDLRDRIFLAYIREEAILSMRFASGLSLELDEGQGAPRTLVHVTCRFHHATPSVLEASLHRFVAEASQALGLP